MDKEYADILEEIRDRHRIAWDHGSYNRGKFKANMGMYIGDGQWSEEDKENREKRPTLTINMLKQPVQQVVNDARQNRIGPQLSPVDGRADKDTATVFEGLIRGVEYRSRAHIAYEYGLEMAGAGGYGFFRITWKYESKGGGFHKTPVIERITDSNSVLMDPFSEEADGSDMEYCFVDKFMAQDEFKRRWPSAEVTKANFFEGVTNPVEEFVKDQGVVISEYWCKKYTNKRTQYQMSDGRLFEEKALADAYGKEVGQFISNDRKIQDCTIWQYFSNGYEVLEDQIEWLDNLWIPIIPVFGKELWVGGKRRFVSIIEDSHDPQRFLNYMVSESAETVALTPKTPYVAAAGQVEDHPEWQDANHKTYDVLTYDPIGVNGKFLPPPQRQNMEPAIAGLSMLTEQAKTFVMSTHGIPKAGFGEKDSGHDSGRALLALQREGDTANFHIHDNLARAVEHGYRILVRIMPKMIDVERQIRIVGEDEAERVITVNRQLVEGGESQAMVGYENKDGERVEAVLDAGMFDVRVSTGPAAATQRLEDSRTLIEVGKMFPALMEVAPDLVIRSLDLKDGDKLAERFTPPQFKEGKDGQKPLPPEVQQAMQQAQQMVDALTEKVNQLEDEKQAKRWDYEGKREIEAMRLASNEMISNADNKIKATIEAWKLDMAEATQLLQAAMRDMEALRQPGPVGAS